MIKKFFKYSLILLPLLFPILVHADTFNPSSALQYYEYYSSGTINEASFNYGNNIQLGSPTTTNYPYAMSLILYGNFIQDKTYTLNANIETFFEGNYFKFYYENLNYLIVNAQLVSGSERTLCNLQPITQNSSYSVGCTFTPSTNLSQIVLSLVNYDWQNNGYVPFGSSDYVKFTNYNMGVYDNSSNIIIDQNNTIINQNNQNTQEIINNQNQNTQSIIDSNKVCKIINKNNKEIDGYLNWSGSIVSSTLYSLTEYIELSDSTQIKFKSSIQENRYYCFYDVNKTQLSCYNENGITLDANITIPNNAKYVRFTIINAINKPQVEICENGQQALNDSINSLDSSLNDDDTSGATSEASDFFGSFTTDTFGLTSIITAPLSLIQSLLSSTCSDLELPLPYLDNKKLTLPCMSVIYSTYFGTFFTLYQTITYGIVAYWVCVRIFNLVKDFKNPEHDEIEVLDL